MIDTNYTLYRILPRRLATRISQRDRRPAKKHATSSGGNKDQEKVRDDIPKGKNFDGFA